jgi:hypothetical protein
MVPRRPLEKRSHDLAKDSHDLGDGRSGEGRRPKGVRLARAGSADVFSGDCVASGGRLPGDLLVGRVGLVEHGAGRLPTLPRFTSGGGG